MIKLKHSEITIPKDSPFSNCQLKREQYAHLLTNLITSYSDGFVLAINNQWGTGKTTFIKMWEQSLKNKEIKTIYLNAWENDFDNNPLVAILSELKTLTGDPDNPTFKNLLKKGAIIAENTIPAIIGAVSKRYIDIDILKDGVNNISKSAFTILKGEVDTYACKKRSLIDFRLELQEYIKENNQDKPIVFIIDELDRCRPNYSVEVLEHIKHFFSVAGIVFVLSIDKEQMGNAVKGFYGSESINSDEYLRRFIDIEYTLPEPDRESFTKYLYRYFEFSSFFDSEDRNSYNEFKDDPQDFIYFASLLFEKNNTTLRQQEKIFALARVGLSSFPSTNYLLPSVYLFLITIKSFHSKVYSEIKEKKHSPQGLLNLLKNIFPQNIEESDLRTFVITEALLGILYYNYYMENSSKQPELKIKDSKTDLSTFAIHSEFPDQQIDFENAIERYFRTFYRTKITYLTNKIDLMENLQPS
jgi:hypothetical protein